MLANQALSAFTLVVLGFAFGVAFDLYRVLRQIFTPGRFLTALCDMLFWLAYTIWVFVTLVNINSGEVRFYIWLCLGAGIGIYLLLFSRVMVRGWHIVLWTIIGIVAFGVEWLNRAIDVIMIIILWPYNIVKRYILRPLLVLIVWLLTPFRWIGEKLNQQRKRLGRGLRRRLAVIREIIAKKIWPPPEE